MGRAVLKVLQVVILFFSVVSLGEIVVAVPGQPDMPTFQLVINISDFGAVPETNATSSFLRAYDAACTQHNPAMTPLGSASQAANNSMLQVLLWIPPHTYYLSGGLTLYSCRESHRNVTIGGAGSTQSVLRALMPPASSSRTAMDVNDAGTSFSGENLFVIEQMIRLDERSKQYSTAIGFENISIDGNSPTATRSLVVAFCHAPSASELRSRASISCGFHASNSKFGNASADGVVLEVIGVSVNASTPAGVTTRAFIHGNAFSGLMGGGVLSREWSNVRVEANQLNNCSLGVSVEGQSCGNAPGRLAQNIDIVSNSVSDVQRAGLVVCSAKHGSVANNVVRHSAQWGIVGSMGSRYISIRGNTIENCGGYGFTFDVAQRVSLNNASENWAIWPVDSVVENNIVRHVRTHGLGLNRGSNVTFSNNTVEFAALGLGAHESRDVKFVNNTMRNIVIRGVTMYRSAECPGPPFHDGYVSVIGNTFQNVSYDCCNRLQAAQPVINVSVVAGGPSCLRGNRMVGNEGGKCSHPSACEFLGSSWTFSC